MELQDLKVFHQVTVTGNISRAAREMGYVQSNVTARIRRLEEELQTTLFHRHSRGVTLTPSGQRLLDYANRILPLVEEAVYDLRDSRVPTGPLALGATESTAAVRLPPLLSAYHQSYPEVAMSLVTVSSLELTEKVLDRSLDCALVAGPVEQPELETTPLLTEELVLVHPHPHLELMGLCNFLVFGPGCTYRARLESWLRHRGTLPFRLLEFGTFEAILGCVKAGMGTGVLTRSAAEHWIRDEALYLHPLPETFSQVPTLLIRRREPGGSRALEAFVALVEERFSSP